MTEYFVEQDLINAKRQRNKVLIIFLISLGVYVLSSIVLLVNYLGLPYKSGDVVIIKLIHYTLTVIFIIFTFLYMGIIFKRTQNCYKLMRNLSTGRREENEANFVCYDEELQFKDGVDMKALIFLEWNKYKKEFFERKVLVLYEKEFPKITEQARVKFITQGNVLVSYEIIE